MITRSNTPAGLMRMVHPVLRRRERVDGDGLEGSILAVIIYCIQFYLMQELCAAQIQQTPTRNIKNTDEV